MQGIKFVLRHSLTCPARSVVDEDLREAAALLPNSSRANRLGQWGRLAPASSTQVNKVHTVTGCLLASIGSLYPTLPAGAFLSEFTVDECLHLPRYSHTDGYI